MTENITTDRFTTVPYSGETPTIDDLFNLNTKGITLTGDDKVLFTAKRADELLRMANCEWERPLRNDHVAALAGAMLRGTFRYEITNLAVCHCVENKTDYRINGQHTSWARTEVSEKDVPPQHIRLLKYRAKTLQDVRQLYASFDRAAPRTKSNVVQSYLIGTKQMEGVPRTLIHLLSQAIAFWKWEGQTDRQRHDGDDIAYLIQNEHAELCQRVIGFAMQKPSLVSGDLMFVRRAPVLAAMLETFSKVHLASEEFWHSVKVGVGFSSQNDPRLKLRNALLTAAIHSHGNSDKKAVDRETMYRWCITCFNAWRAGEQVIALRLPKNRVRAK